MAVSTIQLEKSVIKLNYIFTISEKMVKKQLFTLPEEKKKILTEELAKRMEAAA